MKGNSKKTNVGFGNAMFAIKDVQNMYENFGKPEDVLQKKVEIKEKVDIVKPKPQEVKKIIPKKEQQKPKIILKPQPNNLIKPLNTQNKPNNISSKPSTNNIKKEEFKNNQQSLGSSNYRLHELNLINVNKNTYQLSFNEKPTEWGYHVFQDQGKTASQIVPDAQINFKLNSRNIKQGSIGNCYFICSLAALTDNIQILKRRIPNSQKYNSKSHEFKVNMFQSGKYVEIKVQNSFQNNFSKPIENDITCLVLQKAYAQLYGNYEIINMGHSIDAFRDLSGNVAEYIDLKDQKKCTKQIIDAFESQNPMVIASKIKVKDNCISEKHSYNVLSYSINSKKLYLQLRDPRGWTKANFIIPKQLEFGNQNGQFWVGYEDLVNNFQVITVSRYMPNSFYYYKTFNTKQLNNKGVGSICFQVQKPTKVSMSIHQKHKKFFDVNHQYNVVNLMLCQVDHIGRPLNTLKTNFNSQQVCSLTIDLQPGRYGLIGQIHPFKPQQKQPYPQQKFTLSLNTSNQVLEFKTIQNFKIQDALTKYMQQNKKQFKQLITKQNLCRYHGVLFGKLCILYQNKSNKKIIEDLEFQTQNIEIKQTKIKLQEDQVKIVMYPIGPKNNCSHKCVFKSKTCYFK